MLTATTFLRKIPVTYPSYDDPSGQVYNAERLVGVPSTLFFDRRGKQTFVMYADRHHDAQRRHVAVHSHELRKH